MSNDIKKKNKKEIYYSTIISLIKAFKFYYWRRWCLRIKGRVKNLSKKAK